MQQSPETSSCVRRIPIVQPVLLALGIACAYWNSLSVPFVFDDIARIVDNEAIRSTDPSQAMANTNRPFVFLTFAWNYAVGELNPVSYHVVNVLVHFLSSCLLFGILYRTLALRSLHKSGVLLATFISLLWAVHPLNTQAVTYVVQRIESLMAMFYLATIFLFSLAFQNALEHKQNPSNWATCLACLSLLTAALAMGCKEVAVTLPVAVLWYDRVFVADSWRQLFRQRWLYYVGLSATWLVLIWSMLRYTEDYTGGALLAVDGLTPWTYLSNQSQVITHYLKLCVWPDPLCFYYNWPIQTELKELLPYLGFIGGIFLLMLVSVKTRPRLGFVLGMFFLVLGPTSSVVPIEDLAFEHRMYLPLTAVLTFLVLALFETFRLMADRFVSRIPGFATYALTALVGVSIVLCVWKTRNRNLDYRSHVALWESTTRAVPRNADAWHNLAMAFRDEDQLERSAEAFGRELELRKAQKSVDDGRQELADAAASYGAILVELGDLTRAVRQLREVLETDPKNYLASRNLGSALLKLGQPGEAMGYLEAALSANPTETSVQLDMGAACASTGRFLEAIRLSEEVLKLGPNARAHVNAACGLGGLGRYDKAIEHCKTAIELDPRLPNAHGTLALLLAPTNRELSRKHLLLAAELERRSAMYDIVLAEQAFVAGNTTEAREHFQNALTKEPQNEIALQALKRLQQ